MFRSFLSKFVSSTLLAKRNSKRQTKNLCQNKQEPLDSGLDFHTRTLTRFSKNRGVEMQTLKFNTRLREQIKDEISCQDNFNFFSFFIATPIGAERHLGEALMVITCIYMSI